MPQADSSTLCGASPGDSLGLQTIAIDLGSEIARPANDHL